MVSVGTWLNLARFPVQEKTRYTMCIFLIYLCILRVYYLYTLCIPHVYPSIYLSCAPVYTQTKYKPLMAIPDSTHQIRFNISIQVPQGEVTKKQQSALIFMDY